MSWVALVPSIHQICRWGHVHFFSFLLLSYNTLVLAPSPIFVVGLQLIIFVTLMENKLLSWVVKLLEHVHKNFVSHFLTKSSQTPLASSKLLLFGSTYACFSLLSISLALVLCSSMFYSWFSFFVCFGLACSRVDYCILVHFTLLPYLNWFYFFFGLL